jgi:hypothetical protein
MQTPNKPVSDKRLDSFIWIPKIMDEEGVSFGVANVYSYMLCKYTWFNGQGKTYYETQDKISEGARTAIASTKTAIKWLSQNGFIEISKRKGGLHFNNQYVVHDRYGIYNKSSNSRPTVIPKPAPRKLFIQELEDLEDQLPF